MLPVVQRAYFGLGESTWTTTGESRRCTWATVLDPQRSNVATRFPSQKRRALLSQVQMCNGQTDKAHRSGLRRGGHAEAGCPVPQPALRAAVGDAQVRGQVAGPGKLLDAQVARVLDAQGTVHLHVPVQTAPRGEGPVARPAEGRRHLLG